MMRRVYRVEPIDCGRAMWIKLFVRRAAIDVAADESVVPAGVLPAEYGSEWQLDSTGRMPVATVGRRSV